MSFLGEMIFQSFFEFVFDCIWWGIRRTYRKIRGIGGEGLPPPAKSRQRRK
jgi:hypothetical protein